MAALIRNLQKRFPKARILGHRDLPDIHKACLCNDICMDQNAEKSFQNLDDMPEISGMIMQGGKTLPQIQGRPLQGSNPSSRMW